jgi:hypothetical protein
MAGCAGSWPCSVRGDRERALPRLLLRPARGGGPPGMGTARVSRHAFPTGLATLRAAFLAAFTAERTKRLTNGWIEFAARCHGCCGLYHTKSWA